MDASKGVPRHGPPSHPAMDAASLYRAHAPYVARFLMKLGIQESDVADVLQDVFLVAHRRGGYQPGPAKPTTWLSEIAVRVVSTARRTRRRRPLSLDTEHVERAQGSATLPEQEVQERQALGTLERALAELPTEQRALVVLFDLEGESCPALAEVFGVPVGTIYSRIHTAHRSLRRAYEKLEGAPIGLRTGGGDS